MTMILILIIALLSCGIIVARVVKSSIGYIDFSHIGSVGWKRQRIYLYSPKRCKELKVKPQEACWTIERDRRYEFTEKHWVVLRNGAQISERVIEKYAYDYPN